MMGTRVRWLKVIVETIELYEAEVAIYQSIVRRHANLISVLDARSADLKMEHLHAK